MENNVNVFLKYVYDKRKYSITRYIKYRRFLKSIVRSSPSFGFFWQVSDFIRDAEEIFFYDNTNTFSDGKNSLFASRSFKAGESGFRFHSDEFDCTVKLFSDESETTIEIQRNVGSKLKSTYRCDDSKWYTDFNKSDELMMDYIVDKIMRAVRDLLIWCYNKRHVYK